MVRDDRDNLGVDIVFGLLLPITLGVLLCSILKARSVLRRNAQCVHLLVLYVSISVYCCCTPSVVRIAWYLDIAAHYSNHVYNLLEDLPDLLQFTAYSAVACLW